MSNKSEMPEDENDKLPISNDVWWHNACLNFTSMNNKWNLYADGYKQAGDLLVKHVIDTQSEQDILVYPIFFLYRHYIELRLKDIIRLGRQLLDDTLDIDKIHDLKNLWKNCRMILERIWTEESNEELNTVEECVCQFIEKDDPKAQSFRYPTLSKGNPSLFNLKVINLKHLSEIIEKFSILDGASLDISEYLDNKAEMMREYHERMMELI